MNDPVKDLFTERMEPATKGYVNDEIGCLPVFVFMVTILTLAAFLFMDSRLSKLEKLHPETQQLEE